MNRYIFILPLLIVGCGTDPHNKYTSSDKDLLTPYALNELNAGAATLAPARETPFVKHVFGNTLKTFKRNKQIV
jgi:hypothetical protein